MAHIIRGLGFRACRVYGFGQLNSYNLPIPVLVTHYLGCCYRT